MILSSRLDNCWVNCHIVSDFLSVSFGIIQSVHPSCAFPVEAAPIDSLFGVRVVTDMTLLEAHV